MTYVLVVQSLAILILILYVGALCSRVRDLEREKKKRADELDPRLREAWVVQQNLDSQGKLLSALHHGQYCATNKLEALIRHLGLKYVANPESRFDKLKK